MANGARVLRRPQSFDVVCAGEAPGCARVAHALASNGVRVGLATTLDDDGAGRALASKLDAAGIDTSGVTFTPPTSGVVLVVSDRRAGRGRSIAVPDHWSSSVLVLFG